MVEPGLGRHLREGGRGAAGCCWSFWMGGKRWMDWFGWFGLREGEWYGIAC